MIYKFDILFKKKLKSGGIKVVTYSNLLDNPEAFGVGEEFADAEGELSMVLEGPETGFSINALMRKYGAQLVGHMNAEMFGKGFPMRFVFSRPDDLSSIRIEMRDEEGYTYSSDVHTLDIQREKAIDLTDVDSFVVLIAKGGGCDVSDAAGNATNIASGQAFFCSANTPSLTIKTDHSILISATSIV